MQEYKLLVRSVWGGATIIRDGAIHIQSLDEAQGYVNDLLSNGYSVLSVDYLGEVTVNELEQANSPKALRFAWHLVKDSDSKAKKSDVK